MGALATLRAAGLAVEALPDGHLRVTPAERLTDDLRALIHEHKAAILAQLADAERDMSASAIRERFRQNAAALLAELEALPALSQEQEDEAAYYRSVVTPRQRMVPETKVHGQRHEATT